MSNGDTPHEKAEQDTTAAERMRELQHADEALAHAFDSTAATLATLGYGDASENLEDSADDARHAAGRAKYGADTYGFAAQTWTDVEHDLGEQAKLTGEKFVADSTAAEAHQTIAGAHGLTDQQRTDLELLEARESASSGVYAKEATAMGAEALQEAHHAQALEESARLVDPESGMAEP